jgi:tetratricopeptide (TPR) repeat protein
LDHQQITKIKSLLHKQRYSAVIDICENHLLENEDDVTDRLDAIYFRAYAHSKMGQTGEALNDIEYLVFVHDPKNVPGMVLKANVLKVLEQTDEAQDLYERVLSRDPDNSAALISLARYYLTKPEYLGKKRIMKNMPHIAHTFEKVLKIDSQGAIEEHMTKGLVAHAILRHENALQHFDKVLELDPEHKQAKLYRCICLVMHNSDTESNKSALTHFNKILEQNPNDKTCLYYKAIAHKHLTKYKDAIEALKKLVIISPDSNEAWNQLGQIYALDKQHFDALDHFEKALALDSYDLSSMRLKAVALYNIGIYDESLQCFNDALDLESHDRFGLLMGKAYTLSAMKKWKQVTECYDEILRTDPNHLKANELRLQSLMAVEQK